MHRLPKNPYLHIDYSLSLELNNQDLSEESWLQESLKQKFLMRVYVTGVRVGC